MEEILDDVRVKKNRTIFSKMSLLCAIINLGLLSYSFYTIQRSFEVQKVYGSPKMIIIRTIQGLTLVGIILTVLSFSLKENNTWYKWLGAVIYTIFCLLILGAMVVPLVT